MDADEKRSDCFPLYNVNNGLNSSTAYKKTYRQDVTYIFGVEKF